MVEEEEPGEPELVDERELALESCDEPARATPRPLRVALDAQRAWQIAASWRMAGSSPSEKSG